MGDRDRGVSRRSVLAGTGLIGYGVLARHVELPLDTRQEILARIDPAARMVGAYTAYQLEWEEFIGSVDLEEPAAGLRALGYESNPLSAAKFHPETEDVDDVSLRRVDPEAPRWQWHVHMWDREEETELFSHYEYRPDVSLIGDEGIREMRQRIRDHYDAKWDTRYPPEEANYFLGEACERVIDLVNGRLGRSAISRKG